MWKVNLATWRCTFCCMHSKFMTEPIYGNFSQWQSTFFMAYYCWSDEALNICLINKLYSVHCTCITLKTWLGLIFKLNHQICLRPEDSNVYFWLRSARTWLGTTQGFNQVFQLSKSRGNPWEGCKQMYSLTSLHLAFAVLSWKHNFKIASDVSLLSIFENPKLYLIIVIPIFVSLQF